MHWRCQVTFDWIALVKLCFSIYPQFLTDCSLLPIHIRFYTFQAFSWVTICAFALKCFILRNVGGIQGSFFGYWWDQNIWELRRCRRSNEYTTYGMSLTKQKIDWQANKNEQGAIYSKFNTLLPFPILSSTVEEAHSLERLTFMDLHKSRCYINEKTIACKLILN